MTLRRVFQLSGASATCFSRWPWRGRAWQSGPGPFLCWMADYRVYCSGTRARQRLLQEHASLFSRLVDEGRRIRLYDRFETVKDDETETARMELDPRRVFEVMGSTLDERWLGQVVVHAQETASTQDVLRNYFKDVGRGVVAIAESQSNGRGRRGHSWESPTGCLTFSFSCQLSNERFSQLLFVQYLASLAVVQSLKRLRPALGSRLRIKWPNDVLVVGGQKVAGVLCEGVSGASGVYLCVGVGLNVANDRPTISLNSTLAEAETCAAPLTREEVLAGFLVEFEGMFDVFERDGFDAFLAPYYGQWLHSNQRVTIRSSGRAARITGLTGDGLLAAADAATGEPLALSPDMSSFDLELGIIG